MARQNPIYNPSLEVDISSNIGFENNTGQTITPVRDTTTSAVGSASLKIPLAAIAETDNGQYKVRFNTSNPFNFVSGQQYTLSFYAKASAAHDITAGFEGRGQYGFAQLTTSWQRFTWTFTPGSSGTDPLHFLINNGQAHDIWIDGVMLETGGTASAYFDGSSSNTSSKRYYWGGTAHNSISYEQDIGVQTINGLAYASIKTVNGLAIASVKTVNGLS